MAAPVVDVVELRKAFERVEVLRGVSFRLDKGETLVVMGGSGSGKTVLLRHVAGLVPSELSGGMRKRVGVARALVIEPELMLFDEPTAGLDPTNAKMVGELIVQLKGGVGDTSIVVTHDVELARTVADRLAILMQGRFAVVGRPDEVMTSGEPAVQAFLAGGGG